MTDTAPGVMAIAVLPRDASKDSGGRQRLPRMLGLLTTVRESFGSSRSLGGAQYSVT